MIAGVVLVTAGCSTGGGSTSGGDPDETGDKTVITYATNGDDALVAAEEKIIAAFEDANPDITVQLQPTSFADYDTKIGTELRGGGGADIYRVNHPNAQLWAGAGYLADLTPVIADNGIDTSVFIPGMLEIGRMDGSLYTLPVDTGNRALYYNLTLFEAVGLAEPPATWDELKAAVEKFKDHDAYGYCYATNSDYAMAYETAGPYIATAGGAILSSDSPSQAIASTEDGTIAALTLLQDIVKTGEIPPGEAAMDGQTMASLFAGDQCAMMIGGAWVRPQLLEIDPDLVFGEDYSVAVVPTPKAGQDSATTGGGWMIGLNAKSKNLDAAAKFLAFYMQPDNLKMQAVTQNNYAPTLDGMDMEPYTSDPFYDAFREMLPNTVLPIVPVAQMAEVSAEFEVAGRASVTDGKDVVEQLKAFDDKVNEQVLQ
ncbi:MAG: sugar ABC transporter substrate-binding protein [Propionibacteriaceae bacterium]|jgi:multiple sugar transport system substrate-binding protein|nr:sugar ABC transporter substrate-binding protein [Propionibacteriaceae bacterium]